MPLRRLLSLLLVLLLCAALPARAGVTYTFAGSKVDGCTLSGKTYTCPALPLPNWDDKVVIAGGYTVTASGDVNFGYNHGLSMSGGAILNISGNLDIGNINPSLLQINGASFIAGGKFSFGAQSQTIVANITANTMSLGTGSQAKVTGTITAKGDIAIASNTTIVGPVSGAAITTNSTVNITGDVTGTKSFTLCSSCTVKGNIKAPEFEAQSSSGIVNGNIDASTSVRLGHGVVINGNVTTGELTMYDTDAIINGNATVNHATLQWHDRVSDTIICSKGSTPGKCDCVDNYSGYDVRNIKTSGNGPYCEGKSQPLDHFVIGHSQTAGVCVPTSVTVTACANAACTATFAGGTSVYLQPTKQKIDIGTSGVATASVQMPPGSQTLALTSGASGGALSASCRVNGSNAASNCAMTVSDAALGLDVNKTATSTNQFRAGDDAGKVDLGITALTYQGSSQSCVPLFQNVTKNIAVSFEYDNPAAGKQQLMLDGKGLDAKVERSVALAFGADGRATVKVSYPDAGRLKFNARHTGSESAASGSVLAVAAPASFKVALADVASPRKAASPFRVTVTALNTAGATTPNFGQEAQPALVKLTPTLCQPANGTSSFSGFEAAPATNKDGVQDFTPLKMNEVGTFDVGAALATSGYLGSTLNPTGTTNTAASGCTGASALFVPAWFQVEADTRDDTASGRKAWGRTTTTAKVPQYYANEAAIALTVTAMNLDGTVTKNYQKTYASDVVLSAVDAQRQVPARAIGTFARGGGACASGGSSSLVCAELFAAGSAALKWSGGSFALAGTYAAPTAPATLRVRATENKAAADNPVSSREARNATDEPQLQVLWGRARLSSGYGYAGKALTLPLTIEYWDGAGWRRNFDDSTTALPATAFVLTAANAAANGAALNPGSVQVAYKTALAQGRAELQLQPAASLGRANVDIALNLGTGTSVQNASCVAARPANAPANAPFLRSVDASCADTAQRDPRARAAFGIFTPENRRIIHVREVFR